MRLFGPVAALLIALFPPFRNLALAAEHQSGRVVILVVWDGLRADAANPKDTPHLAALMREGTVFAHNHSLFPTLTMVNAAAFATGATPGTTGILGNSMYVGEILKGRESHKIRGTHNWDMSPVDLEHTSTLAALNGTSGFDGALVGAVSFAQELEHQDGYVAIIGKGGPTFLFDDRASSAHPDPAKFLFIAGDQKSLPKINLRDTSTILARDAWYTRAVIQHALPAAEAASRAGRPSLIVLWQHDPDLIQHLTGLGTAPALAALHQLDGNLAQLRHALAAIGLARQTDLMVVSDHGFATIRMEVRLSELLVTAGLKKSRRSEDIIVARNGGADLVYLSPHYFPSEEARRAMLARIVDFAAAQDWCGPIFSHAGPPPGASASGKNLGWIPGTFSQELIGIYNSDRSPDLFISFREVANTNNHGLTGPANPAFELGSRGQIAVKNHSSVLLRPVAGVIYADNSDAHFTTGMGMHGAAGQYELRNFFVAAGPDFRRHFIDANPTGNSDLAPTVRVMLGLLPKASQAGRVLGEALTIPRVTPVSNIESPSTSVAKAYLVLQGAQIESQLNFTSFAGETYLDDSSVIRAPIGPPQ